MMTASSLDYLTEWLQFILADEDGFEQWLTYFGEACVAWQLEQAQTLLRAAKRTSLPTKDLALVRYSEGMLYAQLGEWDRAVKSFMQGLDLLEDSQYVEEGIWILNELGMVLRLQGNHQGAEAAHRQAWLLAKEIARPDLIAEALEHLGLNLEHRGNNPDALNYFQQALAQREALGEENKLAYILNHLGRVYWLKDDLSMAHDAFQRALDILESADNQNTYLITQIQSNLGNVFHQQGHLGKAESHWRSTLEKFNTLGVVYDKVGLLNNLGALAVSKADDVAARKYFRESLELARELGDQRGEIEALNNLGIILSRANDWAGAANCYYLALQIDAGIDYRIRHCRSLVRIHILIALDWLRRANLCEAAWSSAWVEIRREVWSAIICVSKSFSLQMKEITRKLIKQL